MRVRLLVEVAFAQRAGYVHAFKERVNAGQHTVVTECRVGFLRTCSHLASRTVKTAVYSVRGARSSDATQDPNTHIRLLFSVSGN